MGIANFTAMQGTEMPNVTFEAEPSPLSVDLDRAALVIIDMQRDFLEPGGFGEALGNDVSRLQAAVGPLKQVLAAARQQGMLIIHTREGHRPDLSDAPPHKVERGDPSTRIGAKGPMGRILVRGEPGHDIIPELYPLAEEPVIDKPGKGAFYQTDLELMLHTAASTRCSSVASPRKFASIRRCARPTTAASATSYYRTVAALISRNSTRPAWP